MQSIQNAQNTEALVKSKNYFVLNRTKLRRHLFTLNGENHEPLETVRKAYDNQSANLESTILLKRTIAMQ